MNNIIINYLEDTYELTFIGSTKFMANYKGSTGLATFQTVIAEIKGIFDLTNLETERIFNTWLDKETIKLNNIMVDIQHKMYNDTGLVPRVK
jgi:hypothetical protein